jgi:hypothetical protein
MDNKMDSNKELIEGKPDGKIGNVDPKALKNALTVAESKADTVVTDQETVEIEDTDDEEAKHLKEDIDKLQLQIEEQKKSKFEAEKLAKKEKKRLRRERL